MELLGGSMKTLSIASVVLLASCSYGNAQPDDKFITVAVIDTGINSNILKQGHSKGVCKMGHKDFTGTGLADAHGHGTNISGLIHKYAKGKKYCQVILKFYDPRAVGRQNLSRMIAAIRYAVNIKVDFINISGGGVEFSELEKEEIIRALDSDIKIVSAAGNEKCNLDVACKYYPAMYDPRIVVVGNGKAKQSRHPSSNWGTIVDFWIDGTNKKGEYGSAMTGTSQSTAIKTGELVRDYVQSR
jgi:subtilisin family serine protease